MKPLFTLLFALMFAIANVEAQQTSLSDPNCNPVTVLPWTEGFEETPFPPNACWAIVREQAGAPVAITWARNTIGARPGSGTAFARHQNTTTAAAQVANSWLILPAVTIPATGIYELNFWTRFGNTAQVGRNAIYISTTDTELSSFTLLQNLTQQGQTPVPPTGWQERIISLEVFAGQTIHIAFRFICRGGTLATSNWDIDDILVQHVPPRIVAQTPTPNAYDVGIDTDIVLTFDRDITVLDMDAITVVPALAGMNASVTNNDRSITITHDNFAYSTVYTVTIPVGTIEHLTEEITWSFRAESTCTAPTQVNFIRDFEPFQGIMVFPPDCWVVESSAGGAWTANNTTPRTAGGWQARHPSPPNANLQQTSWLITEQIVIPATGIHELVFWTRWGTPANNELTAVYVSTLTNNTTDFVRLQELTPEGLNTWQERVVSLESLAGETIYLAFLYVSRGPSQASTTWDIDDVRVQQSELRLLSFAPASNALGVELDRDIVMEFNLDLTIPNLANITVVPQPAGMEINIVNNRNIEITHNGFAYETTYEVTIPAGTIVGQENAIMWRFRTEINCGLQVSLPWTEGFEGIPNFANTATTFPPSCWDIVRENTAIAPTWARNTSGLLSNSTGHARHAAPSSSQVQTSYLITRAIEIPSTGLYELVFWSRVGSIPNSGNFAVWISTTNNQIASFTELRRATHTANNAWTKNTVSLEAFAGDTIFLAFRYQGRGATFTETTWDIDNITVQAMPIRPVAFTPANNSVGAELNQNIVVEFNQNTTYTTFANITVYPAISEMNVSLVDNIYLTITHSGFAPSTIYTVTIPAGTIVGYDTEITWTFRSVPACAIATPSVDFSQGFELTQGLAIFPPDCWVVYRENTEVATTWTRNTLTLRPGTVAHARHPNVFTLTGQQPINWLITEAIEMPATGIYYLYFYDRFIHGNNGGTFGVWISTTDNNPESFELLSVVTPRGVEAWRQNRVSLAEFADERIYLAFRVVMNLGVEGEVIWSAGWDINGITIEVPFVRWETKQPAVGATGVQPNTNIVVTFNQDVEWISNHDNITITYGTDGEVEILTAVIDGNTLTITHEGFVAFNTEHTVYIPAQTFSGVVGYNEDPITWSFRAVPLTVASRTPDVDATIVALDAPIVVTFSHDMQAVDLTGIAFDPPVLGIVATVENGNVLTITHDGLQLATDYTITIPAGTIAYLEQVISWTFRTVPYCGTPESNFPWTEGFESWAFPPDCWTIYRENPAVVTTWGRNTAFLRPGSTGHARSPNTTPIFTNWLITEAFDIPATNAYQLHFFERFISGNDGGTFGVWVSKTDNNPESFELLFNITAIPGTGTPAMWRENSISLVDFAGETIYLAFRVQSNPGGAFTAGWDIDDISISLLPIRAVSKYPVENYDNVRVYTDIYVTFNQPIEEGALFNTISINPPLAGGFTPSIAGRVLTIQTLENLEYETLYTITIPVGAIENFTEAISWSFTTTVDNPIVLEKTPATNAVNVAFNADITLIFNQDITLLSYAGITFSPAVTGVSATVLGEVLTITHDGFTWETEYTITIPTTVIEGLVDAISWSFTIAETPASVPYFQNFANADGPRGLPARWTVSEGAGGWQAGIGESFVEPNRSLFMTVAQRQQGINAWAFSEPIWLDENITYFISFYYMAPGGMAQMDSFRVKIGSEPNGIAMTETGTLVFEKMDDLRVLNWTNARFVFTPSFTGIHHLGIQNLNRPNQGGRVSIDAISIIEAIDNDLVISYEPSWLTQIPISQTLPLNATVTNRGLLEQTNIVLSATQNGNNVGTSVPFETLAPYASTVLQLQEPITPVLGPNVIVYTVTQAETDALPENNVMERFVVGTENVFARDLLDSPNPTGLGIIGGGTFAVVFEVTQTTTLSAVQLFFSERGYGNINAYLVRIFPMTGPLTADTTEIARRAGTRVPGVINTVDFSDEGTIVLNPGRFAVALSSNGFVDISSDGRETGVWYGLNTATGEMTFNTGVGAPGIRMVISDDIPTRIQTLDPTVIAIYPNPVDDILHIQTTELVRRIEIFTLQGSLVMATENITTFLDVSNLPSGVYVIRFITDRGIVTQRFVKR